MVIFDSSVSVGTLCFTGNRSRSDILATFGYLREGIRCKPYELLVSVSIFFVFFVAEESVVPWSLFDPIIWKSVCSYWFHYVRRPIFCAKCCRQNIPKIFCLSVFLCQMLDFRCTSMSVNVGIGNKFLSSNICVCIFTPNVIAKCY